MKERFITVLDLAKELGLPAAIRKSDSTNFRELIERAFPGLVRKIHLDKVSGVRDGLVWAIPASEKECVIKKLGYGVDSSKFIPLVDLAKELNFSKAITKSDCTTLVTQINRRCPNLLTKVRFVSRGRSDFRWAIPLQEKDYFIKNFSLQEKQSVGFISERSDDEAAVLNFQLNSKVSESVQRHAKLRNEWCRNWSQSHPIAASLRNHHRYIFRLKTKWYVDMPFYDAWNYDKGGSFIEGENCLLKEIGPKPGKFYDLHVVDKSVGIMPGNLVWVPRDRHKREELVFKQALEIKQLRERIKYLESGVL